MTPGSLVRTAASLAHGIVTRDAAAHDRPTPVYLSGSDHDRLIKALLEEEIAADGDGYWPTGLSRPVRGLLGFRTELRDFWARAVERGVGSASLAGLAPDGLTPSWAAIGTFIDRLSDRIREAYAGFTPLDSTYVLRRATELAAARDRSAAGIELLVVDDAQELGYGAAGLVAALAAGGARLTLLGDPDLATGGYRGALPGEFLSPDFWTATGRVRPEPIVLPTAHRHGAAIRAAVTATTVGGTALGGAQRAATGAPGQPGTVEAIVTDGGAAQLAVLARRIRRLAVDGTPWSRIAVIARNGASVPRIARELRGLDVPASGAGVSEIGADDWASKGLSQAASIALRSAASGAVAVSPEEAEELLGGSLARLDALSVRRLRAALRRRAAEADRDDPRGRASCWRRSSRRPADSRPSIAARLRRPRTAWCGRSMPR